MQRGRQCGNCVWSRTTFRHMLVADLCARGLTTSMTHYTTPLNLASRSGAIAFTRACGIKGFDFRALLPGIKIWPLRERAWFMSGDPKRNSSLYVRSYLSFSSASVLPYANKPAQQRALRSLASPSAKRHLTTQLRTFNDKSKTSVSTGELTKEEERLHQTCSAHPLRACPACDDCPSSCLKEISKGLAERLHSTT